MFFLPAFPSEDRKTKWRSISKPNDLSLRKSIIYLLSSESEKGNPDFLNHLVRIIGKFEKSGVKLQLQ